jgi:hypothetical protein
MSFQDFFIVAYPLVTSEGASTPTLNLLTKSIIELEKQNPTKTVFAVGTVEPGIDNFECPMRTILAQMEKQSFGAVFAAGCVEPGIDNFDSPLRKIIDKLEKK